VKRVQAIGAGVSLGEREPEEAREDAHVKFIVRLFVDLDDYGRIVDPQRSGMTLGVAPPVSLAAIRATIEAHLIAGPNPPSSDHRARTWARLIRELSDKGIAVEAETLQALPFRLEIDYRVIERFGEG
jgi:hypothetical protein